MKEKEKGGALRSKGGKHSTVGKVKGRRTWVQILPPPLVYLDKPPCLSGDFLPRP